ncbi:hypothetical protein DAD99_07285 [Pseudarthrobacter sp. AB1]|nr:hypothetical protein [Pseudarthrobacter sp. AB1]
MSSCLDDARPQTDPAGTPHLRPALHYTARDTWLNDSNGLVFYRCTYHLYYQNNPDGNVWGTMSWGQATSTDLVHWTEQPVAIACDDAEDIDSGSVVVSSRPWSPPPCPWRTACSGCASSSTIARLRCLPRVGKWS